jgi:hypothetical protein
MTGEIQHDFTTQRVRDHRTGALSRSQDSLIPFVVHTF